MREQMMGDWPGSLEHSYVNWEQIEGDLPGSLGHSYVKRGSKWRESDQEYVPKVGEQLLEWQITLHLCYNSMYKCGETAAHITISPNTGWTSGFWNANKQTPEVNDL